MRGCIDMLLFFEKKKGRTSIADCLVYNLL